MARQGFSVGGQRSDANPSSSSSEGGGATRRLVLTLSCAALLLLSFWRFWWPSSQKGGASSSEKLGPAQCTWQEGDPTLYHLRTKLGVNYDAGHWFHMSENFLAEHSRLRATHLAANSSTVYLAFDAPGFVGSLNGVTKLFTALGPLSPAAASASSSPSSAGGAGGLSLRFVHLEASIQHWFSSAGGGKGTALSPGQAFMLLPSMAAEEQRVSLSPTTPTEARFLTSSSGSPPPPAPGSGQRRVSLSAAGPLGNSSSSLLRRAVASAPASSGSPECVKYVTSVGGRWPTPQRGHWFPRRGDAEDLRDKIRRLCPAPANSKKKGGERKYKLIIYQRDRTRKLENEIEALHLLGGALPSSDWEVKVLMHAKDRSPCDLAHALWDVDVLLTPHGFQSMLLLFLPRPSLLFEVFPYRYYKRGYGPLGKEYHVLHAGVMSPPLAWHSRLLLALTSTADCMLGKQCRNYARADDVRLTQHGVNRLVQAINSRLLPALGGGVGARDLLY